MPRIAIGACFHETNSFAPGWTDRAEFQLKGWFEGVELAGAFENTRTVVGGFLDGAGEHGLDVVPVFGGYATPAGLVTSRAFTAIIDRLIEGIRGAGPLDGLLLELHGAMVVDGDDDPETTLLHALRESLGDKPIVAVTDLHANITPDCVRLADVLVGYRTNPHTDTYERGVDAAGDLARILETAKRPYAAHRGVPVLAAPIAQATADLPLRRLIHAASDLQRGRSLLNVSVHAGYAYADVPHAGMSFTATGHDKGAVQETVEELAALAHKHRQEFTRHLPTPDQAIELAAKISGDGATVAIADTGDNIGGGAPGDTTWLLHTARKRSDRTILATTCQPEVVKLAEEVGAAGTIHCRLGGGTEALTGPALEIDAAVRWVGDGTFTNTGPMATGARVSMGRSALLSAGSVDIVVQSQPVQPNDPELFRRAGADPTAYDIVLLKGAAAVRAGWRSLVGKIIDAGTPGVTDCDLTRIPYQHLRQPIWPLDQTKEQ